MARAYERTGREREAILAYKRVLELDGREEEAYEGLIRLYRKRGEIPKLVEEWRMRAKLQPKNELLRRYLEMLEGSR